MVSLRVLYYSESKKAFEKNMNLFLIYWSNKHTSYWNVLEHLVEELYEDIHTDRDYEDIVKRADTIQEKIKKMRQCGLDSVGEFSIENVAFKVIRRNGTLERLSDIKTLAYDKSVSIKENRRYL